MKKFLPMVFLLAATNAAWALTDLSAGVYGGLNAPIVQEDAKSGSGFGLKAKFSPSSFMAATAFYESRKYGNPEITVFGQNMSIDGGKVTSIGAEVLLGNTGGNPGPHFYWALGISNYKWKRTGMQDLSKVGYHLGPGLELILPAKIGLELRGKFEIVPTDGGGSRKNALVYFGANYHFGLGGGM